MVRRPCILLVGMVSLTFAVGEARATTYPAYTTNALTSSQSTRAQIPGPNTFYSAPNCTNGTYPASGTNLLIGPNVTNVDMYITDQGRVCYHNYFKNTGGTLYLSHDGRNWNSVGTSVTLQGENGYFVTVVGGQPLQQTVTATAPLTATLNPSVSIGPGQAITIVPSGSGNTIDGGSSGTYYLIVGAGASGIGSTGSSTSATGDSIGWSVNSDGTCTFTDTTTGESITLSPGDSGILGGMAVTCI